MKFYILLICLCWNFYCNFLGEKYNIVGENIDVRIYNVKIKILFKTSIKGSNLVCI